MKKYLYMTFMLSTVLLAGCSKEAQTTTAENGNAEVTEVVEQEVNSDSSKNGFWIETGLQNIEKKDLTGLQLYGSFTDGTPLKDILTSPVYTDAEMFALIPDDSELEHRTDDSTGFNIMTNIEEIMAYESGPNPGDVQTITLLTDNHYIEVDIYNTTDDRGKTTMDCIEAGCFSIGDETTIEDCNAAYAVFPEISCDYGAEYLDELIKLLGYPDYIKCRMGIEQVNDTEFDTSGSKEMADGILYELRYNLEADGFLCINISEYIKDGNVDVDNISVGYYSKNAHDYLWE